MQIFSIRSGAITVGGVALLLVGSLLTGCTQLGQRQIAQRQNASGDSTISNSLRSSMLHVNRISVAKLANHDSTLNQTLALDQQLCSIAKEELDGEVNCQIEIKNVKAESNTAKLSAQGKYDATLEFTLIRYQANIGSAIGSARPASINLDAQLRSAQNNQVIWRSTYAYSDQALSENLLAVRSRPNGIGQWSAINALFTLAVHTLTKELSSVRREAFLAH